MLKLTNLLILCLKLFEKFEYFLLTKKNMNEVDE